jgi:transglutaminase-like putative cysteine protease
MSPGDIAELSQSSALAFRIVADMRQLPDRSELYWRALVLDKYDGTTWTSSYFNQQQKNATSSSSQVRYQYLPADEQANWIMGLEYSIPQDRNLQLYQDDSIRPSKLMKRNQPIQLFWLGQNSAATTELEPRQLKFNTDFERDREPKTQQLAQQLWAQSQQQPEKYVQAVLAWYRKNNFVYTLSPGTLGGNRIDQFLFSSRRGFCEHYASSFTMLMRYSGVPARVVTGYQGGQPAPDGKSWELRQFDAHAWSEVYIKGKWQRIDPTAMIAPQRIDTGMQDYLDEDQTVWGDDQAQAWRLQQFKLLKNMRVWSDYLSYQWQSKIVGYDAEKQQNWLSKLGLNSTYGYVLMLILGIGGVLIGYVGLYWWRLRQQQAGYERLIYQFQKKLPKPLHRQQAETFQVWMKRLSLNVEDDKEFKQVTVLYQKMVFLDQMNGDDIQRFKKLLKDCAITIKQSQKNLS